MKNRESFFGAVNKTMYNLLTAENWYDKENIIVICKHIVTKCTQPLLQTYSNIVSLQMLQNTISLF